MENNNVSQNLQALFKELENFLTTKSVVGEPIKVGDVTIVPLVDISFGAGASAAEKTKNENNGAGGIGAKVSPAAMMVIKGDDVQIINLNAEDGLAALLKSVPGIIKKFTSTDSKEKDSNVNNEENL